MELPRTLRALNRPALRLFFAGHSVSLLGSWMQPVASQWLVWRLTGSTQMLGLLTFCSQVPSLLLGAWVGSVAERVPALFFIGLGQVTQSSGILTELQQRSPPHLRGRLLGLFTMAFVGMVPVGSLVAGLVADRLGSPVTLRCIGGLLAVSAALYLAQFLKSARSTAQNR